MHSVWVYHRQNQMAAGRLKAHEAEEAAEILPGS